jgi:WD40 repeat protein
MEQNSEEYYDALDSFGESSGTDCKPPSLGFLKQSTIARNFLNTGLSSIEPASFLKTLNFQSKYQVSPAKAESEPKIFEKIRYIQEIDLLEKQIFSVWIIKFSDDCKYLSITGTGRDIYIYNLTKKSTSLLIHHSPEIILHGHKGPVTDICWGKSDNTLISASKDCNAILWDPQCEEPKRIYTHPSGVTTCKFFPNTSKNFITGSRDKLLRLFNIDSVKALGFYQTKGIPYCLDFSPNGKFMAAGMKKGEIAVYSIKNDYKLRLDAMFSCKNKKGFYSNGRKVVSVLFIDNERLAVATRDNRIRIVKYDSGITLNKFKGHKNTSSFIPVNFSYDTFMTGSEDGRIYFWNNEESCIKNNKFESFEVRKRNCTEYSVLAPIKFVESTRNRYLDLQISHIIFTIGAKSSLRIFFILST